MMQISNMPQHAKVDSVLFHNLKDAQGDRIHALLELSNTSREAMITLKDLDVEVLSTLGNIIVASLPADQGKICMIADHAAVKRMGPG